MNTTEKLIFDGWVEVAVVVTNAVYRVDEGAGNHGWVPDLYRGGRTI